MPPSSSQARPIAGDDATVHDALRRAEASLHTALEISPDLAVVYREGVVIYANPAVARSLRQASTDELTGRPLVDLLHPEDRPAAEARVLAPAANVRETVALRWLRRDGGLCLTEASAAPIEFDGGHAVLLVARDETERAEFEHQLLQRDRMAALGTLSAGVAHEINNPLTYLLVNLDHVLRRLRAAAASDDPIEALSGGARDGGLTALAESLQHAVDGANRVRQIVRHLLTFAQGNVDRRGLVDVRGVVESAVQMAWHEIRHRARLTKSLADLPPVEANEARLGQVFLSLLVNAAQAIPEGDAEHNEVRVSTRTDELGRAVVEVTDTGVGIPAENLRRIFDPFFTTKGEAGTGLGLAISLGAVRSVGGDIEVKSAEGRGTTLRVTLPPAKPWRAPAAQGRTAETASASRRRVLVIDDERLVGEAIARAISEENDVDLATDARQALDRIRAGERFDLVLCDLMMPVMTGMDLYAEVLRVAPHLAGRVVFMTGGAFTPRARAFLESVGNACLEKPLDLGKLRSILARLG